MHSHAGANRHIHAYFDANFGAYRLADRLAEPDGQPEPKRKPDSAALPFAVTTADSDSNIHARAFAHACGDSRW